jgi:ATP-binding cassette subfamily B protein RaxB
MLVGLIKPDSGNILLNGYDIQTISSDDLRTSIAYVAQDDALFSGSIMDNIAFFDRSPDMNKVVAAAKSAVIHDDIMKMPMRYNTLVGDMGSSLSGGQKARVLIARALYGKPSVIAIDEGSAHLDVETERLLNRSLDSLGMTRILVAHRPETIDIASIVYEVSEGKAVCLRGM